MLIIQYVWIMRKPFAGEPRRHDRGMILPLTGRDRRQDLAASPPGRVAVFKKWMDAGCPRDPPGEAGGSDENGEVAVTHRTPRRSDRLVRVMGDPWLSARFSDASRSWRPAPGQTRGPSPR